MAVRGVAVNLGLVWEPSSSMERRRRGWHGVCTFTYLKQLKSWWRDRAVLAQPWVPCDSVPGVLLPQSTPMEAHTGSLSQGRQTTFVATLMEPSWSFAFLCHFWAHRSHNHIAQTGSAVNSDVQSTGPQNSKEQSGYCWRPSREQEAGGITQCNRLAFSPPRSPQSQLERLPATVHPRPQGREQDSCAVALWPATVAFFLALPCFSSLTRHSHFELVADSPLYS